MSDSQRHTDDRDPDRAAREIQNMLDPYGEQALVIDGDHATVLPGRILDNIRNRMERVDLDPATSWAPEDLMSQEEIATMFADLGLGQLVVSETAQFAREVLARWPAPMVQQPIPPHARLEMFFDGPTVDPTDADIARRVINRSLAGQAGDDEHHPELDDLGPQQLMAVWLAVVFWFGIKSGLLNRQHDGSSPG